MTRARLKRSELKEKGNKRKVWGSNPVLTFYIIHESYHIHNT